jgi:outer membrane receptor for ferrienterochelin and colicins
MNVQRKKRSTLSLIVLLPLLLFSQKEEALDSISMYLDVEEVVVTAQYAPTSSKNALQNIRTISRETIERQGATNLEQLLQQDLSIRIQQDLVLGSSMSLLGMGGENVKIMVDGVPVIGRLDGNIDLSQINLNNVERVEIVEGPMAVSYGTDALAGVINLITKKSQLNDYELLLTQQLETRGESNSMVDAGIRLQDNWLLRLNGGRDQFRGFDDQNQRSSLWNPKDQWYIDASLRRNFGEDHQIRYQFSFFDEEVKNLGEMRRPQFNPYAFDDYYLTRRLSHTLAHEGTVGNDFYWQTVAAFNHFEREVNSFRLDFEPEDQSLVGGDTTTFTSYMLRSVLASKFRQSAVNFQLGVDLRYENGSGARLIDPASNERGKIGLGDYALFGSVRYQPIRSLMVEGGLRTTRNTRYEAPLIPSVHVKYNIGKEMTLRASYGKGFRSPSLKELFLSFIDINHFIIGNPDLIAEQSDNVQFTLNWKKKIRDHRLSLRLNAFHNSIKNQILLFPFLEQGGILAPVSPAESNSFAYFNMEEGKNKGMQLRLSYQYKKLSVEGGVLQIGYFNPLSETIAAVDPFTYTTELNGKVTYQLPFTDTDLSVFVRHNDRFISYYPETVDGAVQARQRSQDGFTMLDASLSQNFFNNRLSISAGVRNLLDIQQLNVSGGAAGAHTGGSGVAVGVGRSFFVRASIKLFDKESASFSKKM